MAEQTINAPASWASLPNPHAVEISAPSGSRPAIDNSLKANEGDERRFGSLDMQGAGSLVPGRFVLNISTATGSSNNLDLSSTFEMLGSVEITVQGRSLLVALAGADTREPYVWTPANSAEVIAFEAYVRGLAANQRAATITLRDFVPVTTPVVAPSLSVTGASNIDDDETLTLNIGVSGGTYDTLEYSSAIVSPSSGGGTLANPATNQVGYTPPGVNSNTSITIRHTLTARGSGTNAIDGDSATTTVDTTFIVSPATSINFITTALKDIKFGANQITKVYSGTIELFNIASGVSPVPPTPDPTPSSPTHTFTILAGGSGSIGYNSFSFGSITAGSTATFSTPGGKSVTVIHCRNVGTELNFALSGAADATDFPTRIVATKTTGGEVVKEFNVQSRSLRPVEGGIRQDYDPASGNINEVFVTNQTIKVDLYY